MSDRIRLIPRAAAGDRLQVWVGVFGRAEAPALFWRLDGKPASPVAVRPLASARPDSMLTDRTAARAFTGVYEFRDEVRPGARHEVEVSAPGWGADTLATRTLPAALPDPAEGTFNVMLVSCFHQHEDRSHSAGALVASLPVQYRPHLTILLGDQVYLDLPTLQDFHPNVQWMAEKFEKDYALNWLGPLGYAQILRQAPTVSTPDDHEYWNDFPRAQAFLEQTWHEKERRAWTDAARAMYDAFQRPVQPDRPEGAAFDLDVPPLSFFVMDTRTDRRATASEATAILSPQTREQFGRWVDRLIDERLFGVIATGQSLLDEPVKLSASDLTLATFADYPAIVGHMARALDAGRPLLLLTGDVHYGRVARALDTRTGMPLLYEVISSPTSLVSFVVVDQVKGLWSAVRGVFGRRNPWPRHGDPKDPPEFFAREVLGRRLPVEVWHRQKGNMIAILSFRRAAPGVTVKVTYWSIHPERALSGPSPVRHQLGLYPA